MIDKRGNIDTNQKRTDTILDKRGFNVKYSLELRVFYRNNGRESKVKGKFG